MIAPFVLLASCAPRGLVVYELLLYGLVFGFGVGEKLTRRVVSVSVYFHIYEEKITI